MRTFSFSKWAQPFSKALNMFMWSISWNSCMFTKPSCSFVQWIPLNQNAYHNKLSHKFYYSTLLCLNSFTNIYISTLFVLLFHLNNSLNRWLHTCINFIKKKRTLKVIQFLNMILKFKKFIANCIKFFLYWLHNEVFI